jgi:hypothetical protein
MPKLPLRSALTLAVAGILIAIGGCSDSPSAAPELRFVQAPETPSHLRATVASGVIGVAGGTLRTNEGHQITFPAGAVSQPTRITIQGYRDVAGVELQPHGLVFPAGSEPELTLRSGKRAGTSGLAVAYVDETGTVAEVLPATPLPGNRVATRLQHFSGYIMIDR